MKRASSLPTWREQIVRAAASAEDSVALRAVVLPMLERALGFEAGVMSTCDPATVTWTSCVRFGIPDDVRLERTIFDLEYGRGDVLPMAELARSTTGVGAVSGLSEAERAESPRVAMFAGVGVTDELRLALRIDGACWGSLVAYRAGGAFDADDLAIAQALGPTLAAALRVALLRHAADDPGGDVAPGVLRVNGDQVEPLGDVAAEWLAELGGGRPPAIVALLARAASGDPHPHAVLQGRNGAWIRVHLVPGAGSDHLAIVEPARAVELAWTLAVAYGLTPRERTVTMGVARGLSAKEIASALEISPWTVHEHVQSALAKVGVESRQALVARLFRDHVLPRREQGLHPGPWGWFAS